MEGRHEQLSSLQIFHWSHGQLSASQLAGMPWQGDTVVQTTWVASSAVQSRQFSSVNACGFPLSGSAIWGELKLSEKERCS